jgi:hypothetical protein
MNSQSDIEPVPTHPEEFKATYDYRIGRSVVLQGSVRMTPAGLVTLGIAVSSILLSVAAVLRAKRGSLTRADP